MTALFSFETLTCMTLNNRSSLVVLLLLSQFALGACASKAPKNSNVEYKPLAKGLEPLKVETPVELRLKADANRVEKVSYFHRSRSRSFEDNQVRTQKDETLEFVSQATTVKVEADKDRFTQVLTTSGKQGAANLNDFAMPEVGEKLEVTANSRGKILKSGDYPDNSIFFVSPISLPEAAVSVGDTWTMQSNWLSLGELVPYRLDMLSILKGFWKCGAHRCAEIEISGEVGLQGPIAQSMAFKSLWRGRIYFDVDAGTVVWSRVDSDESFSSGNVRRDVSSCLEAVLTEPEDTKIPGIGKPTCQGGPTTDETVSLTGVKTAIPAAATATAPAATPTPAPKPKPTPAPAP